MRISPKPTPYAITCRRHGQVFLTREEYLMQMQDTLGDWVCPKCEQVAEFDEVNYKEKMGIERR